MLTIPEQSQSIELTTRIKEKRIEEERIHDVLLILENLFQREEATVKLVLDCLYDVGSVNLINQKIRHRPVKRVAKLIARMTKPAFRFFALRWFQSNCPKLITEWLHSQVRF